MDLSTLPKFARDFRTDFRYAVRWCDALCGVAPRVNSSLPANSVRWIEICRSLTSICRNPSHFQAPGPSLSVRWMICSPRLKTGEKQWALASCHTTMTHFTRPSRHSLTCRMLRIVVLSQYHCFHYSRSPNPVMG